MNSTMTKMINLCLISNLSIALTSCDSPFGAKTSSQEASQMNNNSVTEVKATSGSNSGSVNMKSDDSSLKIKSTETESTNTESSGTKIQSRDTSIVSDDSGSVSITASGTSIKTDSSRNTSINTPDVMVEASGK